MYERDVRLSFTAVLDISHMLDTDWLQAAAVQAGQIGQRSGVRVSRKKQKTTQTTNHKHRGQGGGGSDVFLTRFCIPLVTKRPKEQNNAEGEKNEERKHFF
jgi:hypothetical protein